MHQPIFCIQDYHILIHLKGKKRTVLIFDIITRIITIFYELLLKYNGRKYTSDQQIYHNHLILDSSKNPIVRCCTNSQIVGSKTFHYFDTNYTLSMSSAVQRKDVSSLVRPKTNFISMRLQFGIPTIMAASS